MERREAPSLQDILTMDQVHHILHQAAGDGCLLEGSEVEPACPGIAGFVGDHFRVTLHARQADRAKKVNIFVKCLPLANEPKAKTIDEQNFYRREMLMFDLFEKMGAETTETSTDCNPWCTKAYICNERVVVMPDLRHRGYRQRPTLEYFDLKHTLLTMASIARFHAAFANYDTKRNLNGYPPFNREYEDQFNEPSFKDSPWLHAAAKLTTNFLKTFSEKCSQYPVNLEEILIKLFITACDSLTESNSLNVVNHRDLWVNNIMFKYEGENPVNALLIDFQCVRYGPPAFDVMVFLYLNTSRSFRKKYEHMILRNYYTIFVENITKSTKERLQILGYNFSEFFSWCQKARMFGIIVAVAIFPYTLMNPETAQKAFDNPETYIKHCNIDRTEPVVAHAMDFASYRLRQLEVSEEFIERYVPLKGFSRPTDLE